MSAITIGLLFLAAVLMKTLGCQAGTNQGAPVGCEGTAPDQAFVRETGKLNIARSGHTATLLKDGKVLVAGEFGGDSDMTAELYDPRSGMISRPAPILRENS